MRLFAALLAGGGGTRFRGAEHKLLADLGGRPIWEWSMQHLVDADVGATLAIVVGAVELTPPPGVAVIVNDRWAHGQATSLDAAVGAARVDGAEALLIGLADQPFIEPSAWQSVAGAPASHPLVVATYGGRRGPNPVRIAAELWPLLPTTGDEGARSLVRDHPEWVREVACLGNAADIDTLEDLERWTSC